MESQQLPLPTISKTKSSEGSYCLGLSTSFNSKDKDYDYLLKKETSNITFFIENHNSQPIINAYLVLEFFEDGKFLTQSLSELFNINGKNEIQSTIEITLEYPSMQDRNFKLMEVAVSITEEIKFHNKTRLLQIPFQYLNGKFRLSELSFSYTDE